MNKDFRLLDICIGTISRISAWIFGCLVIEKVASSGEIVEVKRCALHTIRTTEVHCLHEIDIIMKLPILGTCQSIIGKCTRAFLSIIKYKEFFLTKLNKKNQKHFTVSNGSP